MYARLNNWTLTFDNKTISAQVPGDITIDLYRAGLVKNPYFGLDYKDIEWVARRDFTYRTTICADKELLNNQSVTVVFDGIDVFADVYLNGTHLGATKNMFLQYRYEIRNLLHEGNNTLTVEMHSTLNAMDKIDTTGYYAIFNEKRMFVRKAQCHFGWDWAPKICAYGIWNDVYIECGSKQKINDVYVVADAKGNAAFFVELNYNINSTCDTLGVMVKGSYEEKLDDKLHFYVSDEPFAEADTQKTVEVVGKKNFACFVNQSAKLWWPVGYGEQPLYNYRVELERDGKIISVKSGRFAYRTVSLVEEPKGDTLYGYQLKINGVDVFVKGSNWIPIECFTGVVTDDKYRRLTSLAKDGNFNMLRVWGGGIYEKDIFYDLCDELGLMVWQDMMLACAEIPEDNADWVNNMFAEVDYQVRRLRNHPSLVYWCGGNEKTGCYGLCITKGEFFTDVTMRGLVTNLDRTRPFAKQSPCSWTDLGNDVNSGETHHNSFERALSEGMDKYRNLIAQNIVPFVSEAALMGPNSVETTTKIYPSDKLWPMNEIWDDRLMKNPYSLSPMTFADRELYYAETLYGKVKSLADFTFKGMTAHAEGMRAEAEFTRSNKGISSGFMNWMYSDIWPQGTWATVDYYCEPKQVYYQMKRSYQTVLVTFTQNAAGQTELAVVNDGLTPVDVDITYGVRTLSGKTLRAKTANVSKLCNRMQKFVTDLTCKVNEYLYVDYVIDGQNYTNVYSPGMWSGYLFDSDYTVATQQLDDTHGSVSITAKKFAKGVFVHFVDNYKYRYDDNYVDVQAGETKVIHVTSDEPFDVNDVIVDDFAKATK